ncbi:MAG: response regulator transcription factor [Bacteroidales bacterium]|nr:response regulator transcription factor [Bacteroidales bacterium]
MNKIRVVLVDDHQVVRDGLKISLLSSNEIEVVGEASSGEKLLKLLEKLKTDIVLLDISLPEQSGIEITEILKKQFPRIKVIIFTAHTNEEFIFESLKAGAKGFLTKEADKEDIINSIKDVHEGKSFLSDTISNTLLIDYIAKEKDPASRAAQKLEDLTQREMEILKLIVEGYANKDIADRLFISIRTVETHRTNIMHKLEMNSIIDLVKFAIKKKLISL